MVGTDVGFALLGPLLNVAGIATIVVIGGLSLFWLPGLALSPLVDRIPDVALSWVGFLLCDAVSYWTQRVWMPQYATLRLAGGPFVPNADVEGDPNPLGGIAAFAEFQKDIVERCEEGKGPDAQEATLVGFHGFDI